MQCCQLILYFLVGGEDRLFVLRKGPSIRCLCLLDTCLQSSTGKDWRHGRGCECCNCVLPIQETRGIGTLISRNTREGELREICGLGNADLCGGGCDVPVRFGDIGSSLQ